MDMVDKKKEKKEDMVDIDIVHCIKKDYYMENCVRRTNRKSIVIREFRTIISVDSSSLVHNNLRRYIF
jgi:hypothetical protein